jgi:hypothetical protein
MSNYIIDPFLCNSYSDEFTPEDFEEREEVLRLIALESEQTEQQDSETCYFCYEPIDSAKDEINWHHPKPKSEGGTETVPAHKHCHIKHHRTVRKDGLSDFQNWGKQGGRISAVDKHWAFRLKNVKDDPLYDLDRSFYQMFYSH